MPRLDGTLTASDNLTLATYRWPADHGPRAVIVLTHGHGEYATKYEHVARAFNAGGYTVNAYDVRGHGRSGGPRGHAPRYALLLDDLDRVVAGARSAFPGLPCYLFGHSFGGQITLNYVLERQSAVQGVVVSAPWLKLTYRPPAWKVALARVLASVTPTFTQDTGLDVAIPMTHDTVLAATYPDPGLRHSLMSARLGMDALAAGEALLGRAGEIHLPLLILHGGADGVFASAVSQALFERAGSTDKALHVYPDQYHEIHNDLRREQVFHDVLAWLDGHTAAAGA